MGRKQCISRLKEWAERSKSALEFKCVVDSGDRVVCRAVINGKYFDKGVGENKKKAKENAAKIALRSLNEKENQRPVETIPKPNNRSLLNDFAQKNRIAIKAVETPRLKSRNASPYVVGGKEYPSASGKTKKEAKEAAAKLALRSLSKKKTIPKHNYRSLLNDHAQKNRMVIKAVETPRSASPCYSYVVGGKEYPSASGKTKKEAKEQAAKLAYHEINGSRTAEVPCLASCETGEQLSTPRKRLDFSDGETNKTTATSDCVESNSPKTQGAVVADTGNDLGVTLIRNKSEFDSIERLDKGGFGHVVKARDKLLNKFFAIKIVPCKDKKALREVQALSELEHFNVIRYYSSWMDDTGCSWDSADDSWSTSESDSSLTTGFLYIQMDLCDTKTLKAWIDECNALGVKKSLPNSKRRIKGLDFVYQIVSGLEYIHSKMFIHRDLKPSNILFKGWRDLKIADFGLVTTEKHHNDENMERTVNRGTPTYMAPEQTCENTYDRKVDIFALGLMYFEILWKISSCHERVKVFSDMRRQTFPKEFSQHFYSEYMIIGPMLSVKPVDRTEASALKTKLEEFKHILDTKEMVRHGNRSV